MTQLALSLQSANLRWAGIKRRISEDEVGPRKTKIRRLVGKYDVAASSVAPAKSQKERRHVLLVSSGCATVSNPRMVMPGHKEGILGDVDVERPSFSSEVGLGSLLRHSNIKNGIVCSWTLCKNEC